jgi:hypothetical protein
MIEVNGLDVRFDRGEREVHAVRGVSFAVAVWSGSPAAASPPCSALFPG